MTYAITLTCPTIASAVQGISILYHRTKVDDRDGCLVIAEIADKLFSLNCGRDTNTLLCFQGVTEAEADAFSTGLTNLEVPIKERRLTRAIMREPPTEEMARMLDFIQSSQKYLEDLK